jgi:ATP/maltotriose-dependent transcriptional regulator MalT
VIPEPAVGVLPEPVVGDSMPTNARGGATAVDLAAARDAYARRDWVTARDGFAAASTDGDLAAADLHALATCAWWLGDVETALPAMRTAHQRFLDEGQPEMAASTALDVAFTLSLRGETAQASGWLGRMARLLEDLPEHPVHGMFAFAMFDGAFADNDLEEAAAQARRARDLGEQFDDPTLLAVGAVALGRLLVRQGKLDQGMALLDEAMVAAVSDELPPDWAGCIYCHLMVACEEIGDLRRAAEWTQVTTRWCESMPGSGPFLGICRVHRAHTLQLQGKWDDAEREAERVVETLADFDLPNVAEAHYVLGDLRRQQGDLAGAEAAFEQAHVLGRDPQPGLALLRLATGQPDVATASIRAALVAAGPTSVSRARLLPAAVEIAVAVGDLDEARRAADELDDLARTCDTDGYRAAAALSRGRVLLADGNAPAALASLHRALRCWQELGAAYEMARVRDALADAYGQLGDQDAARRERDAADAARARLGVRRPGTSRTPRPAGLTEREVEILSHVASGRSNQQIADDLVLSVRTVERHLATIYQKLGVSGRSARAAAVTFAHREGLVHT